MVIDIYTDGASSGNPGPSGYGWVILYDNIQQTKSVGVKHSTNNRMELSAVIDGLNTIVEIKNNFIEKYKTFNIITSEELSDDYTNTINIYSDSQYVCNAFNKYWINKWIKEDFKKIKNPDLWRSLSDIILKSPDTNFNFIWIRGHSGDEYNEIANDLAQLACGHDGIVINTTIKNNK